MNQRITIQILIALLFGTIIIGTYYTFESAALQESKLRNHLLTESRILGAALLPSSIDTLV
ncbi:MAG: hypothetical protein GXY48_05470 [Methanomicrobiales archaeon]|nr:hypothetical protein [Methanomicrobiales archaeon]